MLFGIGKVLARLMQAMVSAEKAFQRFGLGYRPQAHPGQLRRAAVELAQQWRQDKVLRRLEVRRARR